MKNAVRCKTRKSPRIVRRNLMFTVPEIIRGLVNKEVELTVRAIPSGEFGGEHPPFGPVGHKGVVREDIKRVGSQAENEQGSYTIEYRDGATRTIIGPLPEVLKKNGWTWARYMPTECGRIVYRIMENKQGYLSDLTPEMVDKAVPGITLAGYMELWDKLNAERGYPAKNNPKVWMIWFGVVQVKT
ncbi:MAG: hypothetical protein IT464_12830 [Planctomycetes bacterium]|nr:hypothetical protein [Planctomycetota bacterium]